MEPSTHSRSGRDGVTQTRQSPSTTNTTGVAEAFRQVRTLNAQVQELADQQKAHAQSAKELEAKILEGEVACGRMSQQLFELQNAIRIKQRHIAEDKAKLTREISSNEAKMEEIRSIVSRITAITMETDVPNPVGD